MAETTVPLRFYKVANTYQLMPETNNANAGTLVTDANELKTAEAWYSNPDNYNNIGRQEFEGLQSRLADYRAGRSEFLLNSQGNLATQGEVTAQKAQADAIASGSAYNVGTKEAPLTMPYGSPGALLSMNPKAYADTYGGTGVQGYNPAGTYQEIPFDAKRFEEATNAAKTAGVTSPSNYEGAVGMYKEFLPSQKEPSAVDTFVSQDPYLNTVIKGYQDYMSQQNQRTSLVDTYKSMLKESGIQGIDTELINMKNIINGTEDDIRTEVTKAGGFATDSQVMALSNARNKQLIKNYNTLLETRNSKAQYLDTLMNLTQQDRQEADQRFEQMTNFGFKVAEINQQMKQSAISTLDRVAKTLGWDGVYQSTQGNPQLQRQIEMMYGLPAGGLAIAAQRDAQARLVAQQKETLDAQYKQAQIAAQNSPKTTSQTASIQEYEYAKSQGYAGDYIQYQNDDANRKIAIQNGSGLSGPQLTAFNSLADKQNKSPLIAAADRTLILSDSINKAKADPNNGALQLNLVYSYIQALDTYQSAVREGELGLVNSIDSKLGQFSNYIQQINSGQIVRPEVIQQMADAASNIVKVIQEGAERKRQQFKSQADVQGLGDVWNKYMGSATNSSFEGSSAPTGDDLWNW